MTRQRSILIAVMTLAVSALGLDHFVLRGASDPQPAEAISILSSATPTSPNTSPATPTLTESIGSLAELLRVAGRIQQPDTDQPRNPFAVSALTDPAAQQTPGPQTYNATQTPEDRARQFLSTRKLQALLRDARGGIVLIDNQRLRPGDQLDGFTLLRIDASGAIFQGQGLRVRLRYPSGT
ncbi:MAG: hypothetical protein RIG82_06305 [Phycisphaeraceae bacterium]